jgi:hypothetical protein
MHPISPAAQELPRCSFAIEYDAGADAGSDGEENKISGIFSTSGPLFAPGRHVYVVVDNHRYIQLFLDQRA